VAAFLRRAGGSMLESTGSHGRGVERRVPEMRRMVVVVVSQSLNNLLYNILYDAMQNKCHDINSG